MKKAKIIIVVAMGRNREIGVNSKEGFKLPNWNLPEDNRRFLKLTENHPVIIGHKTLKAIFSQTKDGKAYPNRINIVLTRNKKIKAIPNVIFVHSPNQALKESKKRMPGKDIYILGGAEVYKTFVDITDILDITKVDGFFKEANVYFPPINWDDWALIKRRKGNKGVRQKIDGKVQIFFQSHDYQFMTFKRKKPCKND